MDLKTDMYVLTCALTNRPTLVTMDIHIYQVVPPNATTGALLQAQAPNGRMIAVSVNRECWYVVVTYIVAYVVMYVCIRVYVYVYMDVCMNLCMFVSHTHV